MTIVCGCCEPPVPPTPLRVENRPSLSAVAYRIGTFASFREAMLSEIAGAPELAGLTTRRSDDYGITFLELWAAVSDVLTFYQERYANEAFLRTAQFRDSILRLAALIGYRLRPGVAARTWIAFTLDKTKKLTIPAGQKVQSVPEAGQQPQTFETLQAVAADARLNRLRVFPEPAAGNPLDDGRITSMLDRLLGPALAASLAPGDTVLFFNDGATAAVEEKKIAAVRTEDDRVIVAWNAPIRQSTWSTTTKAFKFRRTFRIYGHNAQEKIVVPSTPNPSIPTRIVWKLATLSSAGLSAGNTLQLDARYENLAVGRKLLIANTAASGTKTLVTVQAVRQVSASLNYTAGAETISIPSTDTVTEIDVLPDDPAVTQVPAASSRRNIMLYELEGDPLVFAGEAYPAALSGDTVYLPGIAVEDEQGLGVEVGRTIERSAFKPGVVLHLTEIEKGRTVLLGDASGATIRATIKNPPEIVPAGAAAGQFCHLALSLNVTGSLGLETAAAFLLGNVSQASHGEKVLNEVVGDGDAAASFQRFSLRKKPLTYLPGQGPDGIASTLQLRVDGVRWQEVPQLFGQPGDARVYELQTADDGTTTIQFGDAVMGAVVPTGRGNVTASYRVGVGLAGRVPANSLTTLLEKPTGLAAATNPLAAEGGADPETLAEARQNAPRTVRTFGRIVSLDDFEDQVTASGEVAKALATFVWDGLDRAIHLTIAGQEGAQFSDDARRDLGLNLNTVRDPNHRLLIANYIQVFIEFRAGVGIDAAFDTDAVLAAAREAVLNYLAFDNLRLGQSVNLSDLYRVLQDTPGVLFVDVDLLQFKKPLGMSNPDYLDYLASRGASFLGGGLPNPVQGRLRMFRARPDPNQAGAVLAAELASVESPSQDVTIETRAI